MDKPEFVEPKKESKPTPPPKRSAPKATPAKAAGAPPGAKAGPVPQAGVVGGNVQRGATTGTPGGDKVGVQNWYTPKNLGYPPSAQVLHIEGNVRVRMATDASGKINSVVILQSTNSAFDAYTRQMVPLHWKGPPNTSMEKQIVYTLH
jgi:TonB family protein